MDDEAEIPWIIGVIMFNIYLCLDFQKTYFDIHATIGLSCFQQSAQAQQWVQCCSCIYNLSRDHEEYV